MMKMIDVSKLDRYLLLNDDCFKVMKEVPDSSIDLILCDPPYNLASYSTGNMKFNWRHEINNDVAKWDEVPFEPKMLVDEFKRIINFSR